MENNGKTRIINQVPYKLLLCKLNDSPQIAIINRINCIDNLDETICAM